MPQRELGQSHRKITVSGLAHAAAFNLTVSTNDSDPLASPDTFGYYHHASRAVWVRPGRDRADMAATLAHELAHAVTHDAAAGTRRVMTRRRSAWAWPLSTMAPRL